MADEMEDVEAPSPTKTAFTLWMAGSTEEVGQWLLHGAIPLTEHAATWKGKYVGLRDRADHAADRHRQRCRTECKSFDKKDMWLLKIELDLKAFADMITEKVTSPGVGGSRVCTTRALGVLALTGGYGTTPGSHSA